MSRTLKSSLDTEYEEQERCNETIEQEAPTNILSQNELCYKHETIKVESKERFPIVNNKFDDSSPTATTQHLVDDYYREKFTFNDKHVTRNYFRKNKNVNLTLSPTKRTKVLSKKVAPASNVALCDLEHEKMNDNATATVNSMSKKISQMEVLSAKVNMNVENIHEKECESNLNNCVELTDNGDDVDDDYDDDDDDHYYVVNEKPQPTVEERLSKIKEKLDTQYDRKYDEWRLRHRIPGKPRTLIKTKSGVVNVLQYATEDMLPRQIENVSYNQAQSDSNYTNYM